MKLLIDHGSDIDIRDELGFAPIFGAVGKRASPEILRYLLEEADDSVHKFTDTLASPLHYCAMYGNVRM